MDIDILTAPAERTLDISSMTGFAGDFVTLKLWPIEKKQMIEMSRSAGMMVEDIAGLVKDHPEILTGDQEKIGEVLKKDPETMKRFKANPDFDGGFKFSLNALEYGVDADRHSFTRKGKTLTMNRKNWELIYRGAEGSKLCAFIVAAVESFQKEYSLKN